MRPQRSPRRCDAVMTALAAKEFTGKFQRIEPRAATKEEVLLCHTANYFDIAKGDITSIRSVIEATQPILLEEIPITMEEVFVYEMEAKGYGQLV